MLYGTYDQDKTGQQVWVALDTTSTTTPTQPYSPVPVQIVRVVENIGSPQGGDSISLLCTGILSLTSSNVQVTIGGKTATVTSVANRIIGYQSITTAPAYQIVTVTTPSGSAGLVDVTLQAQGSSYTATKAFQYATSRTIYPFSTSPTFLAYDSTRQLLYAAHGNQVEVIDGINQKVLTPLVPASGKLTNSQFAGIALSPDGI
jgi:hypothetical protein